MKRLKVVKIENYRIEFDNGVELYSYHERECCEQHELEMNDLTLDDFKGLEFDLTNDNFFNRIPNYGIELIPLEGHSVKIPAYSYNNGYYSDQLDLIITDNKEFTKTYDITECQENKY